MCSFSMLSFSRRKLKAKVLGLKAHSDRRVFLVFLKPTGFAEFCSLFTEEWFLYLQRFFFISLLSARCMPPVPPAVIKIPGLLGGFYTVISVAPYPADFGCSELLS